MGKRGSGEDERRETAADAGGSGGERPAVAGSHLPAAPDFEAVRAVAHVTAGRRAELFALIGHLTFSWSNNESVFIYVLMLLLRTDQPAAAIVFGTLNTTRARLDLVQRLAKARLTDPAIAARGHGALEYDLGAAWLELTGLPFVFAAWLISPQCAQPDPAAELLRKAKQTGLENLDRIAIERQLWRAVRARGDRRVQSRRHRRPDFRQRPAQSRGHGLGAGDRRALDGRQ